MWSKPVIFLCEKHEDFGSRGWRQETQPDYDPLDGMAVAHDVLEHPPGGDGSPADELRATGAMLHVRGAGGYFWGHRFTDPAEHVCMEMLDIFRHVFDGWDLPDPPRTCKVDPDVEETIDRIISGVTKTLHDEWGDQDEDSVTAGLALLPKVRGWIRIGYRAAVKRYKKLSVYHVCSMFREIQDAADKALKHAEGYEKLSVEIDLDEGLTRVLLVEPDYPDDED